MPGNEKKIAKFLVNNKGKLSFQHLGEVISIGAPGSTKGQYVEINTDDEVDKHLATQNSGKKADIYINGHGVSIKQLGATFSYNRLQRANLPKIFNHLGFKKPGAVLASLDEEVKRFHEGLLDTRNREWANFFIKAEFEALAKFLMMEGSPNLGISLHPAELILEAPGRNISPDAINVYTFDEYFEKYNKKLKISIRRQWVGQASSEHKRAVGLSKKPENLPWVFDDVSGEPNMHSSGMRWRADVAPGDRKTAYFLMLEKER